MSLRKHKELSLPFKYHRIIPGNSQFLYAIIFKSTEVSPKDLQLYERLLQNCSKNGKTSAQNACIRPNTLLKPLAPEKKLFVASRFSNAVSSG